MHGTSDSTFIQRVASELDSLRFYQQQQQQQQQRQQKSPATAAVIEGRQLPTYCRKAILSLSGNSKCMDCGTFKPDWANVTYGVLLCVICSGRHRSYGVATCRIRSLSMDTWTHDQLVTVLEGGNDQLEQFFQRHKMGNDSKTAVWNNRYKTKAGVFYRTHLAHHVHEIVQSGTYQGRDASRRRYSQQQQQQQERSSDYDCCDIDNREQGKSCHDISFVSSSASPSADSPTQRSVVVQ